MNMYTKLELTRFAFIRDESPVLSLLVVHVNDKINDVVLPKICNYTLYSYYIKYTHVYMITTKKS